MKIKVISDAECNLYIDNEKIARIPANELTIIPVEKGEYIVKYECVGYERISIEKDLLVEYDKVERISFLDHILSHKELLNGCLKKVIRGDNGLYGYLLYKTNLLVIPSIYEEAEDYRNLGGREMAYVKKGGYVTYINGQGDPIIPLGKYDAMDYYKNMFIARTMEGNRFVLSDEGVKLFDMRDDENIIADNGLYGFHNLVVVRALDYSDSSFKAYFPSGELIDSLGEFEEIRELFVPDEYYITPLSPYYIISKNGRSGVVRVDRQTKKVIWILPCNSVILAHWERRSDDMYDPICGGPFEEFDTFGLVELSDPESNTYTCIRNYPEHDVLVVSEAMDDENGPEVPKKVTMYGAQGRIVLQRDDVALGIFSYGEAIIDYDNGEKHLIDTSGHIFDRKCE